MAKKKKDKIVQYRRHNFFNIGTVLFGVLFVYMVICMVMYFTSSHITAYEVTSGPLAGNYRYTALALKTEQVVTADQSGTVSYYTREGGKAGYGNTVCSIDKTGTTAKTATKSSTQISESMDAEMLSKIRSEMSSFATNYDAMSYQNVYNFKADVESSILELTSEEELSSLEEDDSLSSSVELCEAPHEGIVVYSVDGYEDLTPENVTSSDFDQKTYQKTNLRLNKKVSMGDSLYKLLTDETWYLVIQLDQKTAAELVDKDTVRFRFLKDSTTFTGNFSILNNADGTYGVIEMNNSLVRYSSDRFLEIELVLNRKTGLKIPNSAIAKKTFYKIPKQFALYDEEEENKEISIIKEVEKKDGTTGIKYINTTVYKSEDTYFLVDSDQISEGDVIVNEEGTKGYTIQESETLEGVYNINKGYAVFREITVIDQNEEYCIVEDGATYGLYQYDHIALDASTVNDEDIIVKK